MNSPTRNRRMLEIFRSAVDLQPVPEGPHFVDDEDLLISWSLDEMSEEQHDAILDHLADCPKCRDDLAAMIHAGALVLPELEGDTLLEEATSKQPTIPIVSTIGRTKSPPGRRYPVWAGLAAAACVLVGLALWGIFRTGEGPLVAFDEKDLGSLLDYGYELDGSSFTKALPVYDAEWTRRNEELQRAIVENPEDAASILKYAQFLLEYGQPDKAEERFNSVLGLESDNVVARLGLGMAAFELQEYEAALREFNAALALDRASVVGHVNTAVCLERLGRSTEAREHWRRAVELTADVELRQRIDAHISGK